MSLCIVCKSTIIRDFISAYCRNEGFSVSADVGELADLQENDDKSVVIVRVAKGDDPDALGLISFRHSNPDAKLIALIPAGLEQGAVEQFASVADTVISDDTPTQALTGYLTVIQNGRRIARSLPCDDRPKPSMTHPVSRISRPTNDSGTLSAREAQVMQMLRIGQSNKEIANALGIVENTVKVHLRACYRKIGVSNRTQAAVWASHNLTH